MNVSFVCMDASAAPITLNLQRFDELTAARGWTTDVQRAAGIGVSHTTLSRIRRGQLRPGTRFIAKAVEALGVEYSELFIRDTTSQPAGAMGDLALITKAELAGLFRVPVSWVEEQVAARRIPFTRIGIKHIRFSRDDIQEIHRSGRTTAMTH